MSIVAVHGPNTFGVAGAGTGGSGGPVIENAQIRVTADNTNGLKFTVEPVNTQRPADDYDWVLTGGTPVTQDNTKTPFVVTYASAGLKTISLTIAAGAGPPAGGTYNINVQAISGVRSVDEPPPEEPSPEIMIGFDPAAHTVAEVQEYVSEHPDQLEAVYEAELSGKNRSTLVSWLEEQFPFDPGDYTVQEVVDYATANLDQLEDIIAAEAAGKNRTTLISQLEGLRQ